MGWWEGAVRRGRHRPLIVVATGLLAYANSLHCPFAFDDATDIGGNPAVTGAGRLWPPLPTRWFATLTFALNYRAGGLDTFGYHLVNLAVHLTAALLVYRLVTQVLRTPFFRPAPGHVGEAGGDASFAALLSALLFVAHPIQTQSVTYIVQRYTSLATMLYLLSLVLFLAWRLPPQDPVPGGDRHGELPASPRSPSRQGALYAGALTAALLAMKTKEISFTLPVVIALFELALFRGAAAPLRRLVRLLPLLATVLVIPANIYLLDSASPAGFSLERGTRFLSTLPRSSYFATQCRVIALYVRLLFFPAGQTLDHDFPPSPGLAAPGVLLALAFLLALLAGAGWLAVSAARGFPRRPAEEAAHLVRVCGLAGGGIVWFFLTLSVESSVIPLGEVIAENRLYLPSVGAFAAFSALLLHLRRRAAAVARGSRLGHALPSAVVAANVAALVGATLARNRVWQDSLRLSEDMVSKAPRSSRAHCNLGLAYAGLGRFDEAIAEYETSLRINPYYDAAHCDLALAYGAKGMREKAAYHYRICQFGLKYRRTVPGYR